VIGTLVEVVQKDNRLPGFIGAIGLVFLFGYGDTSFYGADVFPFPSFQTHSLVVRAWG
jgi:hypothetical protein